MRLAKIIWGHVRFKGIKAIKGDFHNPYKDDARATMPRERKDTQPAAQEEDAEVTPASLEGGGEISAAADLLAAVTLADKDEAGSGKSATERDSIDYLHDLLSDPELWKPHPPTEDCPVCLVPLPLEYEKTTYITCCGKVICRACKLESDRALEITNAERSRRSCPHWRNSVLSAESQPTNLIQNWSVGSRS